MFVLVNVRWHRSATIQRNEPWTNMLMLAARRRRAIRNATIAAISFISCRDPGTRADFTVGAVLPLTGSAAVWGQNARRGMELAIDELNSSRPPGKQLSVIYEDSRSDAKSANTALQKLISANHVNVVIGDIASSSVLAMAPIAEASKVVLLSPGASSPDISNAGDFVFRNWQSDALEGRVDADFAYNVKRWRRIATLYVSNAYGTGLHKEFSSAFAALGGEVVMSESFAQGSVDLRAQITRLRSKTFDALYLPGYPPEMAVALKQMRELGLNVPTLSVQAFDDPEILARAGQAAEGVMFSVPKPPDQAEPVVADFRKHYISRYSTDPGVCSDTGYDAIRIVAWAIDQGARTGTEIRDAFKRLRDFAGAAGTTTFDEHGDVVRPFIFKTVRSGKTAVIEN
jgi:branched-chain amino acid transport system substrate-binding protein